MLMVILVIILGLTSCNAASSNKDSTPGEPTPGSSVPLVTIVATDMPTIAPSPAPERVVLLAPPEADEQQVALLQTVIDELAAQQGLLFETLPTLPAGDGASGVRLVVVLPPDPGVKNLAAGNPAVQFLAVGIPGLELTSNISVITAQGGRPDRQGFLAGYLAAVITADWRVGVISRADIPAGRAARQSFMNGAIFFCGLCRPAYPPFNQYPQYVEMPSGVSQAEQQAAADVIINSAVKTVYVFPGTGDNFLLQYLIQAGMNIIAGHPMPAELQGVLAGQWVATLGDDLEAALRQVWDDLIEGKGGLTIEPPLVIGDINPAHLTTGRLRLVEKIMHELETDYIDTGVDPVSGETR